ncbi:MAG: RND family efflux transporter MFP subunit [Pirellulaceae bacterium]|jgi:RND family efflux transporter MFP subunit
MQTGAKYLFAILSLVVAAAAGWAVFRWSSAVAEVPKVARSQRPMAVEVARPTRRMITERIDFNGSLEAKADVEVRSRVLGYIRVLPFDVGDAVGFDEKEKNLLVGLDDDHELEAVGAATAALTSAQALLSTSKARLDLATKTKDRNVDLLITEATTEVEVEQAIGMWEIAKTEVALEEARVVQSELNLNRSQLLLLQRHVNATSAGVVAERFVEVGDLANPNDPLLRIVDISIVRTLVSVNEIDYQRLRVGQVASVRVDAIIDQTFSGTIVRKSPVIDPATRTAEIQLEINNENHLLKPGMHARVSIELSRREDVMAIPLAALLEHKEQPSVFVASGDPTCCHLRPIRIGVVDGEFVEVLAGIETDEAVVTLGARMVKDGQQVIPVVSNSTPQVPREAPLTITGE